MNTLSQKTMVSLRWSGDILSCRGTWIDLVYFSVSKRLYFITFSILVKLTCYCLIICNFFY